MDGEGGRPRAAVLARTASGLGIIGRRDAAATTPRSALGSETREGAIAKCRDTRTIGNSGSEEDLSGENVLFRILLAANASSRETSASGESSKLDPLPRKIAIPLRNQHHSISLRQDRFYREKPRRRRCVSRIVLRISRLWE